MANLTSKNGGYNSLAGVIQQALNNRLKDVHTSLPGYVVKFDTVRQTASVQPTVKRIFVTKEEEKEILVPSDLPVLINVPVLFYGDDEFSITYNVEPGSECLIVFCERDITGWQSKSKSREPNSYRQHSLSDAVCIVGLRSQPKKINNFAIDGLDIRDKAGNTHIKITKTGEISIEAVNTLFIEAQNINITGDITHEGDFEMTGAFDLQGPMGITGNVTINGDLLVGIVDYLTHVHGGVTSGGSTTAVPQ